MLELGELMRWMRAWFWSVQKPNENWAQTVFRVFGNFLRLALTGALLIVLVILGGDFME